jgi:NAD(P)-dependent dehydrogenase (short-subunit alcohol dehydrogenase family)
MNGNLLHNRVALVTGGASAIGEGIAKALLEDGAAVVLGDLPSSNADEVVKSLRILDKDFKVSSVDLDLTSFNSIKAAISESSDIYGKLDILVNNAGVCNGHDFLSLSEEHFNLTFDVNVKGLFNISKVFSENLIDMKIPGNIVHIASNAAKVCFEGMADYNASKATVVNLTQSMAKELAQFNINVNAVCPGAVDSKMLERCMLDAVKASDGEITVKDCRKTWGPPQLGRLIQPYEVGRVVSFFASDAALIIRGQSLSIDGGNTPY